MARDFTHWRGPRGDSGKPDEQSDIEDEDEETALLRVHSFPRPVHQMQGPFEDAGSI